MESNIPVILILLLIGSISDAFGQDIDVEYSDTLGATALRKKPSKIQRYEVLDVEYDLSRASQTLSSEDITLASKTVSNDSPYDTTSTLSMKITKSTTSEWSATAGMEMYAGVTTSVTAGLPILGDVTSEWKVGVTSSFSYNYGKSCTSSVTTNHDVSVVLPAYSDVRVSMVAKKATVNVPYTATVKIIYERGKPDVKRNVRGVYEDVHYTSFETSVEAMEMPVTKLYENAPISGTAETVPLWSIMACKLFIFCIWTFVLM